MNMSKPRRRLQHQKQSKEKVRQVQELRRSGAAGPHKSDRYNRKSKYPVKYADD